MIPANIPAIVTFTGNNTTFQYAFAFRMLTSADIAVKVTDLSNVETVLTLTTDFTVTFKAFPLLGGTVSLVNAGQSWLTAGKLKTGYLITLEYVPNVAQTSNFKDWGPQAILQMEKAYDKLTMDLAGVLERTQRALQLPVSSNPAINPTFPSLIGNSNKILKVKADESGFDYDVTSAQIHTWRDDAVNAATNSANSAAASATSATNSANSAAASATSAGQAAASNTAAAGHATDAQNSADDAEDFSTLAQTYELAAADDAADALAAQLAAELARDLTLFTNVVDLNFADSPYAVNAIADNGKVFRIDTTGGNFVFNLPTRPAAGPSFHIGVVRKDASANTLTINPFGADTINGGGAETLSEQSFGKVYTQGTFNTDWKSRLFLVEGATGGGSSGLLYLIDAVAQSITAGGQITSNLAPKQLLKVQGAAAPQTASVTPFSVTPPGGAEITVMGMDDVNQVMIPHNDADGGCVQDGDIYLRKYETATYIYDDVLLRYVLIARKVSP